MSLSNDFITDFIFVSFLSLKEGSHQKLYLFQFIPALDTDAYC